MAIHVQSDIRNAQLDVINDAANAGAGPAVIELRDGVQPADADDADVGTVLATFTCEDPAFATPVGGVMDLDAAPDLTDTADNSGTASWARMKNSDGDVIFDGSVGLSGSGADYTITSTTVVAGQPVTLTLGALTQPG